ncbi:DUF3037 domain-containing protein [Leisingera sp. D0M16]|uniref:DUF3037 domain-containing protein n=1 Tax=Leisingera coralii TaxID=3351347 RepID=UPI003B7FE595
MKRKLKFGYCLLQYEHNPWLKERLNIGILVFGPSANYLKLKTRGWDGRILSSYPGLEKANFTEDLKQIERSVTSFFRKGFREPSLFLEDKLASTLNKEEHDALWIGQMLSPDADSSYRWVAGGVGLCSSLDEKLEQLYLRFVSCYDKPKHDANRTDGQVWSTFSSKLSERNLERFIEPDKTVRTDLGPVKFHAGYQNGSLHVIQPLSFDLSDEDHVSSKAAKWAGYAQSVQSYSKGAVKPHFVLGRPAKQRLEGSFDRARLFLEKMSGLGSVVTEENSEQFVDTIERQMAGH